MPLWLMIVISAVGAAVLTALLLHFLTRRHVLSAMEQKHVFLNCSHCGLLVARYEQQADSKIRCVNCKRAHEREALRAAK